MIIFDLDGTLADCEHRRHFVQEPTIWMNNPDPDPMVSRCIVNSEWREWKPNWEAFYESCDKDTPIQPVVNAFIHLTQGKPFNHDVRIWSGRCESVRDKTLKWLMDLYGSCGDYEYWDRRLKMRPKGDSTPDDVLKESWLDQALAEGNKIEFVFDDHPKVVRMWRRRGIFVFNCCQHEREF